MADMKIKIFRMECKTIMNKAWLINIGNTHSDFALFENDHLSLSSRIRTESLLMDSPAALSSMQTLPYPCVIACVVPDIKTHIGLHLSPDRLIWVDARLELGIDLSAIDSSTIGADRVANMVAAVNEYPLPIMIIDCGTAITTTVIDSQRRCWGGAILPGRMLSRWVLKQKTGQLPEVELTANLPEALGTTTRKAIFAGVDLGILGALEKLIAESQKQLGLANLNILIIGGDKEFIASHLDHVISGPTHFTLSGLSWIARLLPVRV